MLFAALSSLALLAATIHEVLDGVRERVFPGLVVLLSAGLTGVFLTGDLFNFYVFFELAMTAAYVLASYDGTRRELGAALVFTAVNLLGTFVFLLSVAGVYHVSGTLQMASIAARLDEVNPNAAVLIAVGFFIAFGVKLGLFPFHFWLPTVYTGARPAVAAILSGGLANIGAYGLLRFGAELLPRELRFASTALIVIGAASILYVACWQFHGARPARRWPTRPSARSATSSLPLASAARWGSPPRSPTRLSTRSTRRCSS